jgi:hypothetical protein
VLNKSDFNDIAALKEQNKPSIVFESPGYLVVNSHKKVADICIKGPIKTEKVFVREPDWGSAVPLAFKRPYAKLSVFRTKGEG